MLFVRGYYAAGKTFKPLFINVICTGIVIALERNLPGGIERPKGREVLEIRGLKNAVLLTGSDLRGAIYAVYQFSQTFLGVDPMYFWTDHAPPRRTSRPVAESNASSFDFDARDDP